MDKQDRTSEHDPQASDATMAPLSVPSVPAERPAKIGRYRIEKVLGEGGFGRVYLARDDQLARAVAIKVAHRQLFSGKVDAEAYLAEARVLASLDHPNIVPVHDVGTTSDGLYYVVSKLVEGRDLAVRLAKARLTFTQAAELVATVAEALHYAHRQGLVHRDIKPANILIDNAGKAYVADFGLALKEQDIGKGHRFAGTPAYMSPEQARGEGHRVDGRSDVFSLGVVFYELLTGRRPFPAETRTELFNQIIGQEARPLRQLDETIPKELERICLKALAKRASERYLLAKDMAEEVRQYLAVAEFSDRASGTGLPSSAVGPTPRSAMTPAPTSRAGGSAEQRPLRIVPKGLRSFDADDADFFLELLPGPRDRDGLPESIRFWKSHIESQGGAATFPVGLIYGPSGCGKSSLVKAGLLPRLDGKVQVVYVEATADGTETRLLSALRKCFPNTASALSSRQAGDVSRRVVTPNSSEPGGRGVGGEGGLHETLAALRRGQGVPAGKKALIVMDQFEQWLHGRRNQEFTDLVQALRQCDGDHVQCIVLVRDDFWLAVSRFMRELEVELVEGRNMALVDLFDQRHAVKVLTLFGRAFAALPKRRKELTADQQAFLDQAVDGLAQDRKVNCVRLALFAEMVKTRPWTLATLKEMGGIAGVGATFLEETFVAQAAPVQHRVHQKAAQAVLRALLPGIGSDIRGQMQSQEQLQAASGYATRDKDFEALVSILDTELRLITPADPEGWEEDRETGRQGVGEPPRVSERVERQGDKETRRQGDRETGRQEDKPRFYQLTHDYLVPSLRDWLSRKDRESRRGRARLRLVELAAAWNSRPETRHLPVWWEWLNIRLLTRKGDWTAGQRKMMRKASRFHGFRATVIALGLAVGLAAGLGVRAGIQEQRNKDHGAFLAKQLLKADTVHVPGIIADMASYRQWSNPLLADEFAKAADGSKEKLHAGLALLPVDRGKVDYVYAQLLAAEPQDVAVLVRSLAPFKEDLIAKLWSALDQPQSDHERLRAACALADYNPDGSAWPKVSQAVALDLAGVPAVHLQSWMEALRPVRLQLVPPLATVFRDKARRDSERLLAADILAEFAADQPAMLADLIMDADDKSFGALFPKVREQSKDCLVLLEAELAKQGADETAKEKLAKRQANAGVALLRLNQASNVWNLLKHSSDPRVRSYLIHRLGPYGADAKAIVKRWEEEPDLAVQRALVLSLGAFAEADIPSGLREAAVTKLKELYRTAVDPGLHAAAEWLLRDWKHDQWLKQTDLVLARDKESRDKKLKSILGAWAGAGGPKYPQWFVNGQGQTMVAIGGPVEFMMGSPPTEAGRRESEQLHNIRISRHFAVAAKPVTLEQFLRFDENWRNPKKTIRERAPTDDCPVHGIIWSLAARYCNWLSEKERIPPDQWCYDTDKQGQVVRMKQNYLSLKGYRMPTEAEMEYACRAWALTSRFYGESAELLGHYAWYLQSAEGRSWPVGLKKPNDLGLFDMHGNILCWCQDRALYYLGNPEGRIIEDAENNKDLLNLDLLTQTRVLRGGFYEEPASGVRSACRNFIMPENLSSHIGFRPARTL